MAAPAPAWRLQGARDKACQRARDFLALWPGYQQAAPAQQVQMFSVARATIHALYAGYTQGQQAIRYAAVRGAVAAAALVGLVIPEHRLPNGAANFLRQQGILAGWGPVAQPLPANAMPPPPPGFAFPAAQAAQAPAPAPAAPAPAPAAPATADDDDDDDDEEDEEDEEDEGEEEEGEGEGDEEGDEDEV